MHAMGTSGQTLNHAEQTSKPYKQTAAAFAAADQPAAAPHSALQLLLHLQQPADAET
jgi:hypothetical protein